MKFKKQLEKILQPARRGGSCVPFKDSSLQVCQDTADARNAANMGSMNNVLVR